MDRNRLLRLVAGTSGGAWEPIENGYRLVLGEPQTKALWKRREAARKAWIAQAADDPSHGWSSRGPCERRDALAAVARTIGASTLAALRPGVRQVWSLTPAAGERPLPPAAREIARGLVSERQKAFEDARLKGYEDPAGAVNPIHRRPASIVFAARHGRTSDDVGLALGIFADDGSAIIHTEERMTAPLPVDRSGVANRMPSEAKPFSEDTEGWAAVLPHDAVPGPAGYARVRPSGNLGTPWILGRARP